MSRSGKQPVIAVSELNRARLHNLCAAMAAAQGRKRVTVNEALNELWRTWEIVEEFAKEKQP